MKSQIMIVTLAIGLMTGCATRENRTASDGTLRNGKGSEPMLNEAAGSGPARGTKFSELPAAVQNTIRAHAPNAKVADIDKETRTGRVVYEVQFSEPGVNPKMHIAEDGTIIESEK
ncbi:MAG: hypothetical protein ABIP71_00530 [Verrucomicrobiota bacterium]